MTYRHSKIRSKSRYSDRYRASFNVVVAAAEKDNDRCRAVGLLEDTYAGQTIKRTFDVKINDDGKFYVSVGSSGHKIMFHVPGWR